uniref:Bulb-type lectin domain-containing protein n=1 Tax=Astyanax mexicanus TaxID=7994 RepID=W5KPS8_ASTMX
MYCRFTLWLIRGQCFTDDGNFVVYGWKPLWASNTAGKAGKFLIMQEDANLVIYNDASKPIWASNTCQNELHRTTQLTINDDAGLTASGRDLSSESRGKHCV